FLSTSARMPRVRASLAASMASIERGTLSGSEWTWMSTTPLRVCPKSDAARNVAHSSVMGTALSLTQVIDFLFIFHPNGRAPGNLPVLLLRADVIVGFTRFCVRVRVREVHLRPVARLGVDSPIVLHQRDSRQRSGSADECFDRRCRASGEALTHEMIAHAEIDDYVIGRRKGPARLHRPQQRLSIQRLYIDGGI